jgi:hypothetical protein
MRSSATSIKEYLDSLPADRKAALQAVRKTIRAHLPAGYEESFAAGFVSYQVPLAVYPDTYNKKPLMYAALASQKGYMALYLCAAYGIPAVRKALEDGFRAAGKRLDMGKSCVRFKRLDDLPLDAIGRSIASTPMERFVAFAKAVHEKKA